MSGPATYDLPGGAPDSPDPIDLLRPSWTLKLRHFVSEHVLFVAGATIFLIIVLAAIFAPWIAPYEPTKINFAHKLWAPGLEHLMGTDALGRDIFSRVVYGARTSLVIGFTVLALSMAIGVPIGLIAGYFGGRVDSILMPGGDSGASPSIVMEYDLGNPSTRLITLSTFPSTTPTDSSKAKELIARAV